MRWIVLALALLFSTSASAQCTGIFPTGTICGNLGGSSSPPTFYTLPVMTSAQLDAICSTNNNALIRLTGTWQCMAYSAQFTTGSTLSIASLAWSLITGTPTTLAGYGITNARQLLAAGLNTYVNNSTGNDSNDCLAATVGGGHGPCTTINHTVAVAKNTVDVGGLTSPVVNVATGTGTYAEEIDLNGAIVGGTSIQVTGTGSGNVTIQAPSGKYAVSTQDGAAIQFSGVTFGCAGGALGEWLAQKYSQIDVITDVKFTACAGAAQINGTSHAAFNFVSAPSFSGNAAVAIGLASYARVSATPGCTIIGAPTYSIAFMQLDGAYAAFAAGSCTGAFTGLKFAFVGNSWAEANGVSFNTVIAGGSNGTLTLGARDDANDPPTAPNIAGTTTYANLPAQVIGQFAYITDGKASNCADTTCTTFGTNVTGGGGALPLLIWWNGAHYTLVGK